MDENANLTATNPDLAAAKDEIDELRAKLAAYENNVVKPEFHGEIPRYVLNGPCFLEDDTLHEEGEEIEYIGRPNFAMVPKNDAAKKRMQEELELQNQAYRNKARVVGRAYGGPPADMAEAIAQAMQDERRMIDRVQVVPTVAMPEEKGEIPAMPHTEQAQAIRRRRGRPPKGSVVVSTKAAPKPGKPTPTPPAILGKDYTGGAGQRQA